MLEKEIERYLVSEVKKLDGKAYKFVSPGNVGVPDRIVLWPNGIAWFVELKATGKKPTALQTIQQEKISDLGFAVFTLDSKQMIDEFINLYVDTYKGGRYEIHPT